MTDKVDIIQNEHIASVDTGIIPPTSTPTPTHTPNPIAANNEHPIPSSSQESYNSQLIIKKVNTLDSYIKKTKRVVKSPIKLPINRVIDYHSPELKVKGVKENNINKI
jgi:translation elongation factor EF-Tu-like GTPase